MNFDQVSVGMLFSNTDKVDPSCRIVKSKSDNFLVFLYVQFPSRLGSTLYQYKVTDQKVTKENWDGDDYTWYKMRPSNPENTEKHKKRIIKGAFK